MWLLLENEKGDEFVVNEKSIKKIEKISFSKTERVTLEDFPVRTKHGTVIKNKEVKYEDENFRFNIHYDDGKSELGVIILKIGDLDLFYEENGFLKKIIKSKVIGDSR